jgi:hypothetical protein
MPTNCVSQLLDDVQILRPYLGCLKLRGSLLIDRDDTHKVPHRHIWVARKIDGPYLGCMKIQWTIFGPMKNSMGCMKNSTGCALGLVSIAR